MQSHLQEENSHSGIARAGEPGPVVDVDLTRGDQDGEVRTVDHVQYQDHNQDQNQDQDQDREVRTVDQDQDTEVRMADDVPDQRRSQRTVTFS